MGEKILFRRGTVANLPDLQEGEPGFATDTRQLFIGAEPGTAASAIAIGGTETPDIVMATGDLSYLFTGGMKKILFIDPNGADRNIDFIQSPIPYPRGFEVCCFNIGANIVILDSVAAAIAVPYGPGKSIYYNGTNWLEHA